VIERSAAYDLQVAVNERIASYIPNVPISEKTQKDTPAPYIELYDISIAGNVGTKCNTIREWRVTIRVFDESGNSDTVKTLEDSILVAVLSSKLVLEGGFNCYLTTHERSEPSVLLKDAKTWMGTTQFLCSVVQTS
jgi:hypothetical protein